MMTEGGTYMQRIEFTQVTDDAESVQLTQPSCNFQVAREGQLRLQHSRMPSSHTTNYLIVHCTKQKFENKIQSGGKLADHGQYTDLVLYE